MEIGRLSSIILLLIISWQQLQLSADAVLVSPRVGAFAARSSFLDTVININSLPTILQQATSIVLTPNISLPNTPTFVFFILGFQEVSAFVNGTPSGVRIPIRWPLAESTISVNTSTGMVAGSSLSGNGMALNFVYIAENLTLFLPAGIELPLTAGTTKVFFYSNGSDPWLRPDDFTQVIVGVTSVGAPIQKVNVTPLSENRMLCSFTAGGVTLHYATLTTVWVDDVPLASNFHLYPPEETLPPEITDFLTFSSVSLDLFPNPVSWVSFVNPVPSRSLLFDPAYSMVLDSSSENHTSWMGKHQWLVILIVVGALLFVLLAVVALVVSRQNRVFLALWQTTYREEETVYRKL